RSSSGFDSTPSSPTMARSSAANGQALWSGPDGGIAGSLAWYPRNGYPFVALKLASGEARGRECARGVENFVGSLCRNLCRIGHFSTKASSKFATKMQKPALSQHALVRLTAAVGSALPAMPEKAQVKTRFAVHNELGQDFTDAARELESVPGTRTRDQHLRVRRVAVDKEMMIGRVRVHADYRRTQRSVGVGQELPEQRAHGFDLLGRHGAIDGIGVCGLAFVMAGDLQAVPQVGKTVKVSPRPVFPNMDRTSVRPKKSRLLRLEPELNLALNGQGEVQIGQQRPCPTPRRQQ